MQADAPFKAFVFGKFMPFHKGHEQLINFARQHCDHLIVLVCASDQELLPAQVRQAWLRETYAGQENVEIQVLEYLESELPNTSETSLAVSTVWADVFRRLLPECQLVVTSEPYGELVAARMGIRYLLFDVAREVVPISASAIRQNPAAHWQFLPTSVKPYYVCKVVILGAEAGRDLIASSESFSLADLHAVAQEHARRIQDAQIGPSPLLIIDTDVHITLSYAQLIFGQELPVAPELYALNRANLYLYLSPDVPFVQDGTRLSADDRLRLDGSHRATLQRYKVPVVEISGNWAARLRQATQLVEKLLQTPNLDD
jgi:HTH-type transcriptional repressor of NAD biosynthesis genes